MYSSAFCQVDAASSCDTIISKSTMRHTGFEPTLREFIANRIITAKEQEKHISPQKSLQYEFVLWFCNDERVILIFELSRDSAIQITLSKKEVKTDEIEIKSKRRYSPFGIDEGNSTQELLSSAILSIGSFEYELPAEAYDDLFSPNFCGVDLPMKQVRAFLSNDREYVYIYICGKAKYGKESEFYDGFRKSYLAKLVISIKNGYETTIVVPGGILELYNWISCPIDFPTF